MMFTATHLIATQNREPEAWARQKVCFAAVGMPGADLPSRDRLERLLSPPPPRLALHVLAPVRVLGSEQIVRSAKQSQVVGFRRSAAFARGLSVIQLQPGLAAAALTVGTHPATSEPIAFEYRAPRGTGNVTPMAWQRRW